MTTRDARISRGIPRSLVRKTAIVTMSQSLSHVLATASSDRDGGQREGTTQRIRVSAAARVARQSKGVNFHYTYNVMPSIDEIFGSL